VERNTYDPTWEAYHSRFRQGHYNWDQRSHTFIKTALACEFDTSYISHFSPIVWRLTQLIPMPLVNPRKPSVLTRLTKPLKTFEYPYLFSGGFAVSLVIRINKISEVCQPRGSKKNQQNLLTRRVSGDTSQCTGNTGRY
jgi:hypothetical protein